MSSNNRARCASFFQKCLSFLDEPDHLVVRALAHEQFARLLLTYNEEIELTSAVPPVESEVIISDAEEESFELVSGFCMSSIQDMVYPPVSAVEMPENKGSLRHAEQEKYPQMSFDEDKPSPGMPDLVYMAVGNKHVSNVDSNDSGVSNLLKKTDDLVQTVSDPLSSKLAAIHHVSQAIKSLRWTRQLQTTKKDLNLENEVEDDPTSSVDFSVCACGDTDCIEICDIKEWLPTSKIDDKLWKLVLLLGESYLSLGQVYKDDGQLFQALKVVELACLVYGSMPKDTKFISSMVCSSLTRPDDRTENMKAAMHGDALLSSNYLFWAKAWTLVGDVYVDFYLMKGQEVSSQYERKECTKNLKISSEVLQEVVRLKKKIGQFNENCSSCSLVNCCCRSDRASSGSSASISARGIYSSTYDRKQSKKPYSKNSLSAHTGDYNDHSSRKEGLKDTCGAEQKKHHKSDNGDDNRNENFRGSDPMQEMNLTACSVTAGVSKEKDDARSAEENLSETTSKENSAVKSGGIFKFLRGSLSGDADYKLSVAVSCYEEALKAMGGLPSASTELQSVLKKKGWACNELGRNRIEMKDLGKAEIAFANAIDAFRQVEDHTNVILINCNLGHGRRALAEDVVSKVVSLKKLAIFQDARIHALETAKLQYSEALWYYGTAKMELNAFVEKVDPLSSSLKTEVNTQFAHTYLKLGMLLASENTVAEVYENGVLEDCSSSRPSQTQSEKRKHEISANDAIREALAVYESLGEVRRQEAAYAHFQLACYQRDCILRFMESDKKNNNLSKVDSSVVQKVKQYAALAERNWQKSADFYGPKSHPVMFLTILIDRSALSFCLSTYLHSSTMLESALTRLLEGRHPSENTSLHDQTPEVYAKFWSQLQTVLKSMVATARSTRAPGKSSDFKKLSDLYKISLKSPDFSQLHKMHSLWTGNHSQSLTRCTLCPGSLLAILLKSAYSRDYIRIG